MFKDLFRKKPTIDHPDPTVRKRATNELKELSATDFARIVREDSDLDVRMNALERAASLDLYIEFLNDDELGTVCAEKISLQIQPEHELAKHSRVVPLRIAHADNAADKLEIARTLETPALIANAIVGIASSTTRHEVAELIYDDRLLAEIEKACRGHDKSLNRQTRVRLGEIKALDTETATLTDQLDRVVSTAKSTSVSDPHYDSRRNTVEREWGLLLRKAAELNSRLAVAQRTPFDLDQLRTRLPDRVDAQEIQKGDPSRFQSILVQLRATSDTEEAIAQCEQDWLEALKLNAAPPEIADEFYSLANTKRRAIKDGERKQKTQNTVERLARPLELKEPTNDKKDWRSTWKTRDAAFDRIKQIKRFLDRASTDESSDSETIELLNNAMDSMKEIVERTDSLTEKIEDHIHSNIASLQKFTEQGELKKALSTERNLHSLINRLPPRRRHEHLAKTAPAIAEMRQLAEWQQFAELPKREELCAAIEALVEDPYEGEQQFEAIKSLRASWNALGIPNTREGRQLQARYDEAADKAFKICEGWFNEIAKIRENNLAGRVAICESLSSFLDNYDWDNPNWRAVVNTLRSAQAEWRTLVPVARGNSRKVGSRFHKLTTEFQNRIDAHWAQNAQLKRDVIESAKAAYEDTSNDSDALIEIMKELQGEWKKIGPAGKRDDQKLWNEFRSTCNIAFEQRQQEKFDRREQIDDNIKKAEELVSALAEKLSDTDFNVLEIGESTITKIQDEFDQLSLPKRVSRRLRDQLRQVASELKTRQEVQTSRQSTADLKVVLEHDIALARAETEGESTEETVTPPTTATIKWFQKRSAETAKKVIAMHELVLRAEVLADIPSPTEDAGKRMQIQASRLQHGLTRGGESDEQKVERLVEDWCSIAYGEQPLRERFHKAIIAHIEQITK